MKTLSKVAVGAAVFSIALGGVAVAASNHSREHGQGMGMKQACAQGGEMRHGHAMEERLSTLKSELKLNPGQQTAWQDFEQTVRNQKATHGAEHGPTQAGTDPMEGRIAHMEQMLAGMKIVVKARQDLYKVLTPEQKAVADRFFQGPHA